METETVILTSNEIRLPRSLIPTPILETLAFLLLIVILFLFSAPSLFELKCSNTKTRDTARACTEELANKKSTQCRDPLSGLQNIEKEERAEQYSKRIASPAHNPIFVLTDMED